MGTILAGSANGTAHRTHRGAAGQGRDRRRAVGLLDAVLAAAGSLPLDDARLGDRHRGGRRQVALGQRVRVGTRRRRRRGRGVQARCQAASSSAARPMCSGLSVVDLAPAGGALRGAGRHRLLPAPPSTGVPLRRPQPPVGVPLVFNLLGPMVTPAGTPSAHQRRRRQLRRAHAGVAARTGRPTCGWCTAVGSTSSAPAPSTVLALESDGGVRTFTVDPLALGLAPATLADLVGDPAPMPTWRGDGHDTAPPRHRGAQCRRRARVMVRQFTSADGIANVAAIDDGRAASVLDALVTESRAAQGAR